MVNLSLGHIIQQVNPKAPKAGNNINDNFDDNATSNPIALAQSQKKPKTSKAYSDIQNYVEKLEKKTCAFVFGCYLLLFGSTPTIFIIVNC